MAIHLIDDVFFEWQFNTGQVSSDKFLFQWRWKLKIYSVVDERRVDEMILEKKLAGDQQSQYISIFLDCPDFTTDSRFDFSEDAFRDALAFIKIAATISAISFTTYPQCQSAPNMMTWAAVPRYNNGGAYYPFPRITLHPIYYTPAFVLCLRVRGVFLTRFFQRLQRLSDGDGVHMPRYELANSDLVQDSEYGRS